MTRKIISLLFAVPMMGLALGACSQDAADSPAANDTAVHTPKLPSHRPKN